MGHFCCVIGCGNRSERERTKSFYTLPRVTYQRTERYMNLKKARRVQWLLAIRRKNLNDSKLRWWRVCEDHFISGKPAKTEDVTDPDWVPSLNMGYPTPNSEENLKRKRSPPVGLLKEGESSTDEFRLKRKATDKKYSSQDEEIYITDEEEHNSTDSDLDVRLSTLTNPTTYRRYSSRKTRYSAKYESSSDDVNEDDSLLEPWSAFRSIGTQTHTDTISVLLSVNSEMKEKIQSLEKKLHMTYFNVNKIRDDKLMILFTGFNRKAFNALFKFLETVDCHRKETLDPMEQFFIFCIYLKTGASQKVLAEMYNISQATVSKLLTTLTERVYAKLKTINLWSTREEVQQAVPEQYQNVHPNCRIVVDCVEIPILPAVSAEAHHNTKNYTKNINTVKGLLAVSPFGGVTFISNLWGGVLSNRNLFIKSGILEKLEPMDLVIADKSFDIEDDLSYKDCLLARPNSSHAMSVEMPSFNHQMQIELIIQKIKQFRYFGAISPRNIDLLNKYFYIITFFVNYQNFHDGS